MPYLTDLPTDILGRAAEIRLVAFDVDGTLTDGSLCYGEHGPEHKTFHVHDGLGIQRLQAHGIQVALISARVSTAVTLRAADLKIVHLHQGQQHKLDCLNELLDALSLAPEQAAFVGDDLPDIRAMRQAGLAIAVANAHPWVQEAAHWRTSLPGGHGAAREVSDLILLAKGRQTAERERWG